MRFRDSRLKKATRTPLPSGSVLRRRAPRASLGEDAVRTGVGCTSNATVRCVASNITVPHTRVALDRPRVRRRPVRTPDTPRTALATEGGTRSRADAPPAVPSGAGKRSATIEPEDLPPVPDTTTPSGLPVRVPQANLVDPLRADEPIAAQQPDEDDDLGRSPEEIKRIMGAYQRGGRRGRSDAALNLGNTAAKGEEEQ
ncbi:hypothetical protein GCM10010182_34120 [Actinomadura cremea]|nr:hypothetical protein GCM10010182_34120 [Actinomadura cremea]